MNAGIEGIEDSKIFVVERLCDGDDVPMEADALFVRLKPGQP
ncbi:hypothetical protein [Mycobacterium sp. 155]